MEQVRVGVIGCGEWGPNHIRVLFGIDGCTVASAADPRPERRTLIEQRFPSIRTTGDASDLLEDPSLDAVIVATPTRTHHDLVRAALLAGKHVLCEKPLTVAPTESEALAALAESSGRVLMVGQVFQFNPGICYLRDAIARGDLGDIHYMDAVRTNLGPIRRDVGAIHDLASHDISIFNDLLGSPPVAVSARTQDVTGDGQEDVAFLTLEYPGGTVCHVHVSWLNPRKVRQLTVVGRDKMAVWDDMQPLEPIRLYDKGLPGEAYYSNFGEFQMILRDGDIRIPRVRMFEPLVAQDQHFVDCVRSGRRPLTDAKSGLAVVRALEAALRSNQEDGRRVLLDPPQVEFVRVTAPANAVAPSPPLGPS